MQRVKNIFTNSKTPVDLIVLKNSSAPYVDDNFFYVTGLQQGLFEGACAILHPDGALDLLVSELEAESAQKSTDHLIIYKTKDDLITELTRLTRLSTTMGVNASGLSFQEFHKLAELVPHAEFIDVSEGFFKTRLLKDEQEIQLIKNACSIADDAMATLPDVIYEEMTEHELAAEINYSLQSLGADKPAFDTISSFGKNTAEPHYTHGDIKLKNGDFIVCDFGACYKKYNSDITRTFLFGSSTTQHKEMYETVLQAQQIAFDAIRPGVKACDVHAAVSSFIDSTKFKGRFIHSTGHCLGLAVHDGTGFAADNAMMLQENMVLTVEPGVYLPGVGGVRIEDDILVTKQGLEILTKSDREFTVLQ
jgi:Xaa-Pro dipeptidase